MRKVTCALLTVVFLVSLTMILSCNQADQPSVTGSGVDVSAVIIIPDDLKVDIDIIPCKDHNLINCGAPGRIIPVAILSTDDFNATTADYQTISFEGADEFHEDEFGDPVRHARDVNDDGLKDLICYFRQADATGLSCGSTEATLSGYLNDGTYFWGTDYVSMWSW